MSDVLRSNLPLKLSPDSLSSVVISEQYLILLSTIYYVYLPWSPLCCCSCCFALAFLDQTQDLVKISILESGTLWENHHHCDVGCSCRWYLVLTWQARTSSLRKLHEDDTKVIRKTCKAWQVKEVHSREHSWQAESIEFD
jgi:hypothetical protein